MNAGQNPTSSLAASGYFLRSRKIAQPQEPEQEEEEDEETKRLKYFKRFELKDQNPQPHVYYSENLKKIKMEEDFVDFQGPKQEPDSDAENETHSIIPNLSVSVVDIQDVEKIQQFAESNTAILDLTVLISFPSSLQLSSHHRLILIGAVEKILNSSQNLMTNLKICTSKESEAVLLHLKFPQMTELKSLTLVCSTVSGAGDDSPLKFGEGFQFSNNFPSLTDLELTFVGADSTLYDNFQPTSSVKRLKFSCDSLPKKILEIFPEIEELELTNIDSDKISSALSCSCEISTKLKRLKLGIPKTNRKPMEEILALVQFISALSGFSMETVHQLFFFPEETLSDLEKLDGQKTLLDLPDLESLTFIGSEDAFEKFRFKGLAILRKLTLDLMPHLKLKFHRRSSPTVSQES